MKPYTVFCQDCNGNGTTWIGSVRAHDADHAAIVGRKECAEEWGRQDISSVHVLGVAEGDVRIVFWEDIED